MESAETLRRFFLEDAGSREPRLLAEEERHAVTVLRVKAGERILGLDGQGGIHPLVVRGSRGGRLLLERDGETVREPTPGAHGAATERIEVAAPLPKGERAEAMLDRLTQLGFQAFRPLACARNQGFARESAESRRPRLERALLEACKQSRRSWLPELHPTARPAELRALLQGRAAVLLSPRASRTLLRWSATLTAGPIVVIAGPEGGFDEEELESLDFATPVVLAPHVLRIETAVEAAVSTLVQAGYERGRS
ncbi:MAG TPA: RsmE family RNA methyltransferase [Planctomycetota bacterium]|nr:RsmE family RNA methyltransferase [Planctomycetota bacterium]